MAWGRLGAEDGGSAGILLWSRHSFPTCRLTSGSFIQDCPHIGCVAVPQAAMKLSTSPQSYRSLRSLQKPGHTLLFKALD